MTIEEALFSVRDKLKKMRKEDTHLQAKRLLSFVLQKSENDCIVYGKENVTEEEIAKINKYLNEMQEGMPIQYITKEQEFMGLSFYVDENVLIPQPDTEILVERTIEILKHLKEPKVLDLCTGSGAIAVSIAKYVPNSIVFASDISKQALEIARQNDNENKVNFVHSNLFENIDGEFNVIVSNPPYIKTSEIQRLSKEVQNEPLLALDGGQDGLLFYREIIKQAHKYLAEQGYLCIEIGEDQKEQVITLINNCSYYKNIQAFKDLSGHDRVIICEKNKSEKS